MLYTLFSIWCEKSFRKCYLLNVEGRLIDPSLLTASGISCCSLSGSSCSLGGSCCSLGDSCGSLGSWMFNRANRSSNALTLKKCMKKCNSLCHIKYFRYPMNMLIYRILRSRISCTKFIFLLDWASDSPMLFVFFATFKAPYAPIPPALDNDVSNNILIDYLYWYEWNK